jgi:hypothetical protein
VQKNATKVIAAFQQTYVAKGAGTIQLCYKRVTRYESLQTLRKEPAETGEK